MSIIRSSFGLFVGRVVCLLLLWAGWGLVGSGAAAARSRSSGADRLVQVATLRSSDAAGELSFGPVAVSGQTIVATGGDYENASLVQDLGDPAAYVFTEPAGQWSSQTPTASLSSANGDHLYSVAASGRTIAAGAEEHDSTPGGPSTGPGAVYVFTEPVGGWAGALRPSATLTASDGSIGGPGAELGSSVAFSDGTLLSTGDGVVYVFTRPAGGWFGTEHESAKLIASDGSALSDVSADGSTIVASGADGNVYVFAEPAGGWSGTVHETAKLEAANTGAYGTGNGGAVVAGKTIASLGGSRDVGGGVLVGAGYVYREPPRGWSGTVHQVASLFYPEGGNADGGPLDYLSLSGSTVGVITNRVNSASKACPCTGVAYEFHQPSNRWSGPLSATAQTRAAGNNAPITEEPKDIALTRSALLVAAEGGIDVYARVTATNPPTASHISLTGLARGKPRLRVRLQAGANSAWLSSFTISLPRGLRFSERRNGLTRNVTVDNGAGHTLTLRRGKLTIMLKRSAQTATVTLSSGALIEGNGERRTAEKLGHPRTHKHHDGLRLKVKIELTDQAGATNTIDLSARAT